MLELAGRWPQCRPGGGDRCSLDGADRAQRSRTASPASGGIPVVTLGGWTVLDHDGNPLPDPVTTATSPEHAVYLALAAGWAGHARHP